MAEAESSKSIRNSTGKLKSKVKGADNGPNYLRASTGSCHDACKYGTPHEFKAKPQLPVRRKSMPKAEIPVEILVPSDRKSTRAAKSSSVVPEASVSMKPEVTVSGRSPSIGAQKSIRQPASSSSMKVQSSHVSEEIEQEARLGVEYLSPDFSNSVKQESPSDVKSLSADSSNSVKQESSSDLKSLPPDSSNLVNQESSLDVNFSSPDYSKSVNQDSSLDVKSSSSGSSNLIQKESLLDVKSSLTDSSISVKQESFSGVKSLLDDSSNLAMQGTSLDMKSSQPGSSSSVNKGSSSGVKSVASIRKGSSLQRHSSDASKSTIQDLQSRRKSSSAGVSVPVRRSSSKPTRTSHLASGSISKTSVTGGKSSSPDASKSVKREVISSGGKAPLKNTSSKLGGSLKSNSARVSTEQQSSSPNLQGRASGNGLNHQKTTGSKIGNDLRTSKEVASRKNMGSQTGSLSLKTREDPKVAAKNIPTSSTIVFTPNLPGTEVARMSLIEEVAQKEGSSNAEATYEHLNGCSDSKKPENEKVPEKTLHVIEVESSSQKSPASDIIQSQLPLSPRSLDSLCQSKSPFSSQDAAETNSEAEYTESEADESVSYYDDDDALDTTEDKERDRGINHEGDESALKKLKFRRGTVIDPQAEVNSPRRLRFRRRSASGNDQSVNNERRRSFKRRDADGNTDDMKPVGVRVSLRHQDVQEKKIEQGLFNRVIEETANKLVETRKSKVMALVGAFETVISLQEGKSSDDKPSPHSSPAR